MVASPAVGTQAVEAIRSRAQVTVDGPPSVGAAAHRMVCACREQNPLGVVFERDLAGSPGGVFP